VLRAKYIPLFVAVMVFLANPLDCLNPWLADSNSMQCCAEKHCSGVGKDDCCAQMVSGHLPAAKISKARLGQGLLISEARFNDTQQDIGPLRPPYASKSFNAYEHGPPRTLDSLHASLLV